MDKFNLLLCVAARVMLALIFLLSGFNKIVALGAMQGYMASVGVPGVLIYPTIVLELGAGLAVAVGYQTRAAALLLAGFSLLTAFIFHNQLGDQMQFIMFMKNVAMAGGLLLLVRFGAGEGSLDRRLAR